MDETAREIALDYFNDDDAWYGSEGAKSATLDDCEIVFEEFV